MVSIHHIVSAGCSRTTHFYKVYAVGVGDVSQHLDSSLVLLAISLRQTTTLGPQRCEQAHLLENNAPHSYLSEVIEDMVQDGGYTLRQMSLNAGCSINYRRGENTLVQD